MQGCFEELWDLRVDREKRSSGGLLQGWNRTEPEKGVLDTV